MAHSSDRAYFLALSLALSLSLSLPFSFSLSDELLWWAFAVVGLLLLEAVLGLALAVLLLVKPRSRRLGGFLLCLRLIFFIFFFSFVGEQTQTPTRAVVITG